MAEHLGRAAVSADGLPDYLVRLLDAAADLPLRHRMPQATATARRSAVLILFGEGPVGPDVLLIEKSAHLRSHAGQPAFPGGQADPGDDYPIGTALREAEEEAGIDPDGVRVLATLQELFLGPSDNLVVPVVGLVGRPAGRHRRRSARGGPGGAGAARRAWPTRPTGSGCGTPSGYIGPAFAVADMMVWGFTAGLLDGDPRGGRPGRAVGRARRRARCPPSAVRPYRLPGSRSTTTGGGRRRADGRRSRARRPSDAYGSAPMSGRSAGDGRRGGGLLLGWFCVRRARRLRRGRGPGRPGHDRPPVSGTVTTAADGVQEITLQTQDDYVFTPTASPWTRDGCG